MEKVIKVGKQYRSFAIERAAVDTEKRTIPLSFSSESPVERWFGMEVLDHSETAVDFRRLKRGGALLIDHDPGNQIGVIEEVTIGDDRMGRAVVRFGRSSRAEEIFQDVLDGIRKNVSVGYQVYEMKLEKEVKDAPSIYRATKWEPLEISLVSIPADINVGIGRDKGTEIEIRVDVPDEKPKEVRVMAELCTVCGGEMTDGKCSNGKCGELAAAQERSKKLTAEEMEKNRKRAIENLCKANNLGENYRDMWVGQGASLEQVSDDILTILEERGKTNPQPLSKIGLSGAETKKYSLIRAIEALAINDWKNAGFELEASRAVAQKLGRTPDPKRVLIPFEVLQRPIEGKRDLSVAAGGGGYLVQTENVGFVEMLYNRSVCLRLGARRLAGLQGNVAIPRMSASATAYWLASETATATETTQTIVQIPLSPKNAAAYTEISRQLLLQSSPGAEGIVSDDLAQIVAVAADYACLNGAGSSGEPDGIIGYSGVGSVTGTSLDYADILEFQADVAGNNVVPVSGGYVTTPTVAALMMQRVKVSSTYSPLWEGSLWDGNMAGFRAMTSNQVPTGYMIFGDWSEMVVGEWGVLEIEVNPYAGFTAGIIGVRAIYSMDVAHRRPFAFSIASSIT